MEVVSFSGSQSLPFVLGLSKNKYLYYIFIFWCKVYSELVTIFGTEITFNWDELLFGLVHSANVSVKNKYLFGILSLAARKAITKKWLKPNIPSID